MQGPQFPTWLHLLAIVSLAVGVLCAIGIAFDEARNPPEMKVMGIVWPLTALFGGPLWVWLYRRSRNRGDKDEVPMPLAVAKGASHCGAGCTLGDLIAEWLGVAFPVIATWFGWHWLFGEKLFAMWVVDFLIAYAIGIVFQYYAIAPMRGLGLKEGIVAAVKADTLSISSWQVGMYGGMALGQFLWFRPAYGAIAPVDSFEFWFLMQLAMLAGFATAYPTNWWLIKAGLKEKM